MNTGRSAPAAQVCGKSNMWDTQASAVWSGTTSGPKIIACLPHCVRYFQFQEQKHVVKSW